MDKTIRTLIIAAALAITASATFAAGSPEACHSLVRTTEKEVLVTDKEGKQHLEWHPFNGGIEPGDVFQIRLTFSNCGPEAAKSIAIVDPIKDEAVYVPESVTGNAKTSFIFGGGYEYRDIGDKDDQEDIKIIKWVIRSVKPGEKAELSYRVKVP